MIFKDKLTEVENSEVFKDWKAKNADSYLAHVFKMMDKENENVWQFGYYNADDTITTFILDSDKISEVPEQQVFKKDKKKLPALDLENVKIGFADAVNIADNLQKEKYQQHPVMKIIAILQVIEDKQVFNITFVTQTFHTLNVRIDSSSSEIVEEKLTSLMEIAKFEKGQGGQDTEYIG